MHVCREHENNKVSDPYDSNAVSHGFMSSHNNYIIITKLAASN